MISFAKWSSASDETEMLKIRKLIGNSFVCKKGCADCCGKFLPVSLIEKTRIEATGIKKKRSLGISCEYLDEDNSCTIYNERPFLCRMFGLGTHQNLTCPHGISPQLSEKRIKAIRKRYSEFIKRGKVTFL